MVAGKLFATALTATLVGAALVAPIATAGSDVKSGERYSGGGGDFLNNAPKWTRETSAAASFRTSKNGHEVLGFRGGYSYYCGAGTNTVSFAPMKISKAGTFSGRFEEPNKGPSGEPLGHVYGVVTGRFLSHGRASVSYLVDYDLGHTLAEPYSMTNPRAVGCGSLVHATLRAHG
jgi:hypothetical protein